MELILESYSAYADILGSFVEDGKIVLLIIYALAFVAGGALIFLARKYHNFLPWLIVVFLFPIAGTIAVGVFFMFLAFLYKKSGLKPFEIKIRPRVIITPFVAAAMIVIFKYTVPVALTDIINDTWLFGIAFAVLFIMFLAEYRENTAGATYFRIVQRRRAKAARKTLCISRTARLHFPI